MIPLNTSPSLFSVDGMAGIVFLVTIAITIAGGLAVAMAKEIVRAVAGLIVCFVGVAGLYFFLNSPFVSMMQILIYVGAVAITISFAVMLAAPEEKLVSNKRSATSGLPAMLTCLLIGTSFISLSCGYEWQGHSHTGEGSMKAIGLQLLTNYSMVFELVSVVLLVAILGALVIARNAETITRNTPHENGEKA